MEYIVYKRFRGHGIDGEFNLRYGTVVSELEGFLFAADGRRICASTSENGWGHFRPNTPEGAMRQEMLERLYHWYEKTAAVKTLRMKNGRGRKTAIGKSTAYRKYRAIGENLSREIWRDAMYAVKQDGAFAGYADSIVPIRLHGNGCYIPCKEAEAEGFCAKMAVTITDKEGTEHQVLSDMVFHLAGYILKGTEPEGSYEEMGAALPLTDAETAAKILLGETD